MIILSKKLFCLILVGLASLAAASICTLLRLPMHQAVILFLGTWVVLITLFEIGAIFQPHGDPHHHHDNFLRGSPEDK